MNKYVIIGGSGFVGSRLISEINSSDLKNLDKNPSSLHPKITFFCDIRDKETIYFHSKTTHVVLLAAEHRDDISPTSLYYDVNVDGTKNVLQKMDEAGIKNLIFTSSVAIYGLNKNNPSENSIPEPFNHYGKSKWQAEQAIKDWYNGDPEGKSVTILRPTVIFGEGNRGNVYKLLKQISSGKFLMIGSGQNKKSMAYVGNVTSFINNRLDKTDLGYKVFNYCDKPDFNMLELVSIIENKINLNIPRFRIPYRLGALVGHFFDMFSKFSGKKFPISYVRVKKFCATTQFDASKLCKTFKAPYSIREALNKTLEHEFMNR